MDKDYCVYIHKNKSNGKRYCGITSQKPEYRWREGKGYLHNTHFQNAISKYGWDGFEHFVIQDGLSREEANDIEKEYITKFNLTDPDYGYNHTNGGDGIEGYVHTDEAKQKISKSHLGHTCTDETKSKISRKNKGIHNGMYGAIPWNKGLAMPIETRHKISANRKGKTIGESHPMFGKKHAEESRRKMSESHKGRTVWNKGLKTGILPSNARSVGMYTDDGTLIKEYPSAASAARDVGGYPTNISACCKGRVAHASGYVWRYMNEEVRI